MPANPFNKEVHLPTQDLGNTYSLSIDSLALGSLPVPDSAELAICLVLDSGDPALIDYVGYPEVQRSVAEELASELYPELFKPALVSDLDKGKGSTQERFKNTTYVPFVEKIEDHARRVGRTLLLTEPPQ